MKNFFLVVVVLSASVFCDDISGLIPDSLIPPTSVKIPADVNEIIVRYVTQCVQLGEYALECCSADDLKGYFTNFYDSRCNLPWEYGGCAAGFFSRAITGGANSEYAREAVPCPAGYFCPAAFICVIPCSRGAYCPQGTRNNATGRAPTVVTAKAAMLGGGGWDDEESGMEHDAYLSYRDGDGGKQLLAGDPARTWSFSSLRARDYAATSQNASIPSRCRLNDANCCEPYNVPSFNKTCGGADRDMYCPAGSYCPTANQLIDCPEGRFCREGSYEPQKCPILTRCPARAKYPSEAIAGYIFLVLTFLVFFLVWIAIKYKEQILWWLHWSVVPIKWAADKIEKGGSNLKSKIMRKRAPDGSLASDGRDISLLQEDDAHAPSSSVALDMMHPGGGVLAPRVTIKEKSFKIEIGFENLGLKLNSGDRRQVLQGVTGSVRPHRVTAVMGPSGAGKTTFLSTLSGKASYGTTTGTILINGQPGSISSFKTLTGFVPQEDTMHRELTAREILTFQALLRLPTNVSLPEKREAVSHVLELLGISNIADSAIGDEETRGVSGGQRKRVNIAMELVSDPVVLFLDEPTSGLDSTSSFQCLEALRTVAEQGGLTIVTVLHQPRYEIFMLFHDVLLLGNGGRTVYLGPTEDALPYFEGLGFVLPDKMNPADFYMDLIAGKYKPEGPRGEGWEAARLFECWKEHQAAAKAGGLAPPTSVPFGAHGANVAPARPMPNFFMQTAFIIWRTFLLQYKNFHTLLSDMVLVLAAGAFLGAVYNKISLERLGPLSTMSSLALGLTSMLSSLRAFGDQRAVYWREASAGVNRCAYFVGVNIAFLPSLIFLPAVYMTLLYTFTVPRARVPEYYSVILATQWATSGFAYALSTALKPKSTQMAAVVLALVSAMLSGISPTLVSLGTIKFVGTAVASLSYARWFTEAMFEIEAMKSPDVYLPKVVGMALRFGFTLDHKTFCIGILWLMGFVSRFVALLFLMFTNRGKQM